MNLREFWLLILAISLSSALLYSQKKVNTRLNDHLQLISQSDSFYTVGLDSLAEIAARKSYVYFSNAKKSKLTHKAKAARILGIALKSLNDSTSITYLEESVGLFKKIHPSGSLDEANCIYHLAGLYYNKKEKLRADSIALAGWKMLCHIQQENSREGVRLLKILGSFQTKKGQHNLAFDYFSKALMIAKEKLGVNDNDYLDVLRKLTKMHFYYGNFNQALLTTNELFELELKNLSIDHHEIALTYQTLSDCERELNHYDNALQHQFKSLQIFLDKPQTKENIYEIACNYSYIGKIYFSQSKFELAEEYFNKCDTGFTLSGFTNKPEYGFVCINLGRINNSKLNFERAITYFNKACSLFRPVIGENLNIGWIYTYIASAYASMQKYDSSVSYYNKYLSILNSSEHLSKDIEYKENFAKAEVLYNWYNQTKKDSLLSECLKTFDLSEKNLNKQLNSARLDDVRKSLIFDYGNLIEKYIGALINSGNLYDSIQLNTAWRLSELAHSQLLYSSLQESQARKFSKLLKTEIENDSSLSFSIINKSKELDHLIDSLKINVTEPQALKIQKEIVDLQYKQSLLRDTLEVKYPLYSKWKENNTIVSISSLQENLSEQQTLVEYLLTSKQIIAFVINKESTKIISTPIEFNIQESILTMLEGLKSYHQSENKTPIDYKNKINLFVNSSLSLYNILIKPIETLIKPELIIIPHGNLANIPFDVLIAHIPKEIPNFKTYPFLLHSHSISYCYSASMYNILNKEQSIISSENFLAMAPFTSENELPDFNNSYGDSRSQLGPLHYSGQELLKINTTFNNQFKIYYGKQANINTFRSKASNFRILHLATHSFANQTKGNNCYVAFATDTLSNSSSNLLLSGEIYNMNFNAELIVLSGCETGIGQLQQGEGIVSLSSAFIHSGARSIIASLWKLNDKSTMIIMDYFYQNLKNGRSKNIALREAKLRFIQENPGLNSHPYYWSAFSCIGNVSPISIYKN